MKKLKSLYIEITNECNLNCPFCPDDTRKKGFMSLDNFKKVLENSSNMAERLYFHVKGEPLLHSQLSTFLKLANDYNFTVHLTSNGTLLKENIEVLSKAKALERINISIQSFECFDKQKQLEKLQELLKAVVELKNKSKENMHEKQISLRLWNAENKENQENLINCIADFFSIEKVELQKSITDLKGIVLEDKISLHPQEYFEWPNIKKEELYTKGFCHGLRNQAAVLLDGTVVPCCLDSEGAIPLGNIFTEELSLILESERAQKIRKGFSERRLTEKLCRTCSYAQRFHKKT